MSPRIVKGNMTQSQALFYERQRTFGAGGGLVMTDPADVGCDVIAGSEEREERWAQECGLLLEAEEVTAGQAFRKFLLLFDGVLVERSAAETVTKGDIILLEKSQGKVLHGTVVAVGSGAKGKGGEIQSVSVKVRDKVLLPEYGGTEVVLDDKDYFLFRDGDILGKYVD
ncbi:10 kDa heat shock protein, mitochondrial-like [Peromyscus eremicus]|uniref:10 kDa heat shock protein, mitochondrial-like n=1 Tax=Peromyscus eremicus TaxID=42410 RepID=UPI0027DE339E|nr:10 kDa heat shock protein, mitochondrial-like [Peromyscus eremicus]